MSENLLYQYDQVAGYIAGYEAFRGNIISRTSRRGSYATDKLFLKRALNSLLPRNPPLFHYPGFKNDDITKAMLSGSATEDERRNEYFHIAMSDYPIDTFTNHLKKKFSEVDFSKLKKIHELNKPYIIEPNIFQFSGFIATVLALVFKSLPKKVFEDFTGLTYEDYEKWVYIVSTSLFIYVIFIGFVLWFKYNKDKSIHTFVAVVLEYIITKHTHM